MSSFRGAVLIMGAITLNTLVCGLLYHPVEQHMIAAPLNEGIDNEALTFDEFLDGKEESANSTKTVIKFESNCQTEHYNDNKQKSSNMSHNVMLESTDEKASHESENKSNYETCDQRNDIVLRLCPNIVKNDAASHVQDQVPQENILSNEIHMISQESPMKKSTDNSDSGISNLSRENSSISENNVPQFNCPQILENLKSESNKNYVEETKWNDMHSISSKKSEKLDELENTRFFDLSVLKDPIYLVILISNSTSAISNTNFMILLPSYAIAEGFNRNSSALLLSIVSALDLIGRISGASLSDIDFIPKYYYFVGGLGTSGIALALLPMANSYTTLAFFCALFGLSSGMYIGITTVILADMLGTEKLSSSYGISLFVNGVLQLIGPPVCGIIFENTLSYKPIFLAFGIILILGTALWAVVPLIKKNSKEDIEQM